MKGMAIIAMVILIFSFPYSMPYSYSSAQGKTLYVGGSGEGNYTSIQDAIDNASDGDKIYIYNGLYKEHVVINKEIEIEGESRNAVIDGYNNGTVIIAESRCEIINLTIENSGNGWLDSGIEVSSEVVIKNCNISFSSVGIKVDKEGKAIVSSCILNTNYYGVLSDGELNISNFLIVNAGMGIYLHHCNGKIENGEIFNSGEGIIAEVSNGSISNCSLHDLSEGISMHGSCFIHINNCNIYGNEYGISSMDTVGWTLLPEPNGIVIEKSNISQNMNAIEIYSSHNVSVIDSVIMHNGWGIKIVSYSYGNAVLRSRIEHNMIGVQTKVAWNNRINYNIIENNAIGIEGMFCITNARHNYWGSSLGPGGRWIGNGDRVIWFFGRIFYFPWSVS